MNNKLTVIEHPKSVQLFHETIAALDEISTTFQVCYEHLDEKTEVGREIGAQLQQGVKAVEVVRNAAIAAKLEGNFLHSALVEVQNEIPLLQKKANDLVVRLERQGKRHHDRERDARLTGQWAAVRGNGRH